MTSYAAAERAALSDLFDRLGPTAPTLCEGWATSDLVAHLVLRERRPDAALASLAKPFAGHAEKVRTALETKPYEELVAAFRSGPPVWSPGNLPAADDLVNGVEHVVHHEDVRRAQTGWTPRTLDDGLEAFLWKQLSRGGRLFYRRARVGVTLRRADNGEEISVHKGTPQVTVVGMPAELLLHSFGRTSHAQVRVEGDPEAARLFATTPLSA